MNHVLNSMYVDQWFGAFGAFDAKVNISLQYA